jgi:hypothetical protein
MKALLILFALAFAVPQFAMSNVATQTESATEAADQYIIVPGPYYYGYYWYPPYYYYTYQPYMRPTGEWKNFDDRVVELEKNVDDLKDLADDVEDRTHAQVDKDIEKRVKELDKAIDALNNELYNYGVYSKSYINELYKNVLFHNEVLVRELGRARGGEVAIAYEHTAMLLGRVERSYGRANP